MNTRLRKSLTVIAASAALMAGGLVTAVPASAESVNKTEPFPTTYDNSNKVVYAHMYYAQNTDRPKERFIYKLTLSTTSTAKQTVYWNAYCASNNVWEGYDTFTGSSSTKVDQAVTCPKYDVLTVTYSTTGGAKGKVVMTP